VSEISIQDTAITARDGYALAAAVFMPADAPHRGAMRRNGSRGRA